MHNEGYSVSKPMDSKERDTFNQILESLITRVGYYCSGITRFNCLIAGGFIPEPTSEPSDEGITKPRILYNTLLELDGRLAEANEMLHRIDETVADYLGGVKLI